MSTLNLQFNHKIFKAEYKANFNSKQSSVDGADFLLSSLESSSMAVSLCQMAYILATVYHETNTTMEPYVERRQVAIDTPRRKYVRELQDRYWDTGFYGRGYVQLTWERNYKTMSHLLKSAFPKDYGTRIDGFLVLNPNLMLDKTISFRVLLVGMVQGTFSSTGRGIGAYINSTEKNYVKARCTVNGTDRAQDIANYAKKFESILNASKMKV